VLAKAGAAAGAALSRTIYVVDGRSTGTCSCGTGSCPCVYDARCPFCHMLRVHAHSSAHVVYLLCLGKMLLTSCRPTAGHMCARRASGPRCQIHTALHSNPCKDKATSRQTTVQADWWFWAAAQHAWNMQGMKVCTPMLTCITCKASTVVLLCSEHIYVLQLQPLPAVRKEQLHGADVNQVCTCQTNLQVGPQNEYGCRQHTSAGSSP
jgi:hypothetical protein